MNVRRFAATLAGSAILLTGCGGDEIPTKAEFISEMSKNLDSQLDSITEAGLPREDAEKLFSDFLGCTYDKIKDDEELLTTAFEEGDSADIDAQMNEKAGDCVEDLTAAATEAATEAAGG